jgi:CDP-diacylglycerol---glycerol-3-phosphate 3-phosphatidyltransferase
MGIYGIKPRFQASLSGIEGFLVRKRVHPDYLTVGALILSILGGIALWGSNWARWLELLIPVVAIVRTALNALDGMVAHDTGLARPFGEVLNETCDRAADAALFTGVALAPGSNRGLGACALVAILLTSYLSIVSKAAGGRRLYMGVMGKADRMIVLSFAAVIAFFLPAYPIFTFFLIVVLAGTVVTFWQRARAAHADLQPGT